MDYTEMKDRIAHIIRAKNLTAAEFALRLGIQPSNVSHLLAGRNNPSLEFVKKLKETFPEYNLDWIVMGKGPMTVSEPFVEPKTDAEPLAPSIKDEDEASLEGTLFASDTPRVYPEMPTSENTSDLKSIIMVYSDDTFKVLSPR